MSFYADIDQLRNGNRPQNICESEDPIADRASAMVADWEVFLAYDDLTECQQRAFINALRSGETAINDATVVRIMRAAFKRVRIQYEADYIERTNAEIDHFDREA